MTTTCPKCQYPRSPTDTAPAWQCPRCGVAYDKVRPAAPSRTPAKTKPSLAGAGAAIVAGLALVAGFAAWKLLPLPTQAPLPTTATGVNVSAQADIGDLTRAEGDYRASGYDTALPVFKRLADQGNAVAQEHLGHMYIGGIGVSREHARGMLWLNKAAAQGYTPAMVDLGFVYETGENESPDFAEAFRWYGKAAMANDCDGQAGLAWLYAAGEGVVKNPYAAYMMLKLAANSEFSATCQASMAWVPMGKLGPNPFLPQAVLDNPQDLANMRHEHGASWAQNDLRLLAKTLSAEEVRRAEAMTAAWQPGQPLPQ